MVQESGALILSGAMQFIAEVHSGFGSLSRVAVHRQHDQLHICWHVVAEIVSTAENEHRSP